MQDEHISKGNNLYLYIVNCLFKIIVLYICIINHKCRYVGYKFVLLISNKMLNTKLRKRYIRSRIRMYRG